MRGLMVNTADCGASMPDCLAYYDPVTHSLRTFQACLFEDSTACCVTLPRSGSMQSGRLSLRVPWERHIHESACSSWPTPTANDARNSTLPPSLAERHSVIGALIRYGHIGEANPALWEWLMGFPIGWTDLEDLATP